MLRTAYVQAAEGVAVKTITPLAWLVGLCVLLSHPVHPGGAEESRTSTGAQYEMPERLMRQVAPAPSMPWRSPDLRGYTGVLKSAEPPLIDPQKRYDLVELIDLAQRVNPETRVAWEAARQAAIGVGLIESEYFPVLALAALGGTRARRSRRPRMSRRTGSSAPTWRKSFQC
jgi:outer membrane protein TolC